MGNRRAVTRTGSLGRVTETDVPGASAAASELGLSTWTATSPDSRTPTLVTEPRKVLVVTIPLPFSTTSIVRPSGRTSTSTKPAGSPVPSLAGTALPNTSTIPSLRSSAGIRFITPTNSATNAVAGCLYSSSGAAICSSLPWLMTPTRSAIDRASSWS